MEGIRVSLECGTTTVGEIVSNRAMIPLYVATPMRGRLFMEAIGQEPAGGASLIADLETALDSFGEGRMKQGVSPHAPHTLSPSLLRELAALAARRSIPSQIHLSESREEASFMHDSGGRIAELLYPFAGWEAYIPPPRRTTSTAYLDGLGLLSPATSVVHCVHVTPDDVHILKRAGVTAVLCPRSNERLAVGKAPAGLLKKCGVPLALGTDSLASNDSLSLWDEMRFLRSEFPGDFTPVDVLDMATLGAARALHLDGETGSLERGKAADFLVVQPARSPSLHELTEVLIEESRVAEVFIAGEAV
jgi:cytosine/adenosine deaminase-related metal-dependent hydrolase